MSPKLDEVKQALGELKLGRSADPTGMVREIFKKCGDGLLYSLVKVVNTIKASKNFHQIGIKYGSGL